MKFCKDCKHHVFRLDVYKQDPMFHVCMREARIASEPDIVTGDVTYKLAGRYISCYTERTSSCCCGLEAKNFVEEEDETKKNKVIPDEVGICLKKSDPYSVQNLNVRFGRDQWHEALLHEVFYNDQ